MMRIDRGSDGHAWPPTIGKTPRGKGVTAWDSLLIVRAAASQGQAVAPAAHVPSAGRRPARLTPRP
jgi:hypothetical protein